MSLPKSYSYEGRVSHKHAVLHKICSFEKTFAVWIKNFAIISFKFNEKKTERYGKKKLKQKNTTKSVIPIQYKKNFS